MEATTSIIKTKASVKGMIDDYDHNHVYITKDGHYSNGHWMLKPEYMPKVQERDINSEFLFEDHGHKEIDYDRSEDIIELITAIYKAKDLEIGFDEKYIAWLQKNIPDFGLKAYDPNKPAFIMSGDEIVGVISSVRL